MIPAVSVPSTSTALLFVTVLLLLPQPQTFLALQLSCESLIFCQGRLLHVVQTSGIFKDSKTFVDMRLTQSPEAALRNFEHMMAKTNQKPSKDDIYDFVEENFESSYEELEHWVPSDYKSNPKFLKKIDSPKVRSFAKTLQAIWPNLGRKVKPYVKEEFSKFTLIHVPNGFIIPGGRFREFYYWDSYWIIKGLLVSEMALTVKGMLTNFFHMIDKFGFVPNGGRIYYLDRSQPPVLALCVEQYLERTGDYKFVKNSLKYLDLEMQFWLDWKTVEVDLGGKSFLLARYLSYSDQPRPESYIEDIHTAQEFGTSDAQKKKCYRSIRSGAESGWDFSARWFFQHGTGSSKFRLSGIDPSRIIPVDLNAFLCRNFMLLSIWHEKYGSKTKAKYWKEKYEMFLRNIEDLLYNHEDGTWYDFDIEQLKQRRTFYASNLAPLWTESYNTTHKHRYGHSAVKYLRKKGILAYQGGIPSTLMDTGQQWDFPNAWAPLQAMVIFGLEKSGHKEAREVAKELARKWIRSNIKECMASNLMFEKYNAVVSGLYGTGGEYEVQEGFGWSNGAILEIIEYYYVTHKVL